MTISLTTAPHEAIPWKPVPSMQWQAAYDRLNRDRWLRQKTDRNRRLIEHAEYIDRYCPELKRQARGSVVDLGPGPGELLEIARHMGHEVLGIDAASGGGGMGDKYLELSKLVTMRQRLPVDYVGVERWLEQPHPQRARRAVLINARGSIEQIFARFLDGLPHHLHHDCRRLAWRTSGEAHDAVCSLFTRLKAFLRPDGSLLIAANGAANTAAYDTLVQSAAAEAGLELVLYESPRVHKWRVRE